MTVRHRLYVDGAWREGAGREEIPVLNPATGQEAARVCLADIRDLDDALAAAARGFRLWRSLPGTKRADYLRAVASLLRERASTIACVLTEEQGKAAGSGAGRNRRNGGLFRRSRCACLAGSGPCRDGRCGGGQAEHCVRADWAGFCGLSVESAGHDAGPQDREQSCRLFHHRKARQGDSRNGL